MVPELPRVEQQQDVERIVDLPGTAPVVAVVPVPHLVPVEAFQLGREDRVEVVVRITADGSVALVEGDVPQVVQSGEQPGLREPAHPGQEAEPDVLVAVLDHSVEAPQKLPVCARHIRFRKRIEDRLVVLVDKHDHPLPGASAQCPDQMREPGRGRRIAGPDPRVLADLIQLHRNRFGEPVRIRKIAGVETYPHHRMPDGPVPFAVDGKPPEQFPVALEEFLRRVDRKALPEAPRARREIMGALLHKTQHVRRLVDIVAVPRPDVSQRPDADGEHAPFHPRKVGSRALGVKKDSPTAMRGAAGYPAGQAVSAEKATMLRSSRLNSTPIRWTGRPSSRYLSA